MRKITKEVISASALLIEEFNVDTCFNTYGKAFVSTCCFDSCGQQYVSSKWVSREDLFGRRYEVCFVDGNRLGIKFVDCFFRRDLWKSIGTTKDERLKFWRAKRGVDFMASYRLSNKYGESYKRRMWLTAVKEGRNISMEL